MYGTSTTARAEIRRLNALHRRVGGPVRDPLARAVSGCRCLPCPRPGPGAAGPLHPFIDATLVAHDARRSGLPSRDERARFYAETRPSEAAPPGIPEATLPVDLEAFEAYLAAQLGPAGPIQGTPTARERGRTISALPLGPLHPARRPRSRLSWALISLWPAWALLPAHIREAYGLPSTARERAVAARFAFGHRLGGRSFLGPGGFEVPQAPVQPISRADGRYAFPRMTLALLAIDLGTTRPRPALVESRWPPPRARPGDLPAGHRRPERGG